MAGVVFTVKLAKLVASCPVFDWLCDVDEARYKAFMEELKGASKDGKLPRKAVLYIQSHGGDLGIACAFYDYFRLSETRLVTIASGQVESAAVILFLSGKERYVSRFSSFLVHDPFLEAHGEITIRNLEQTRQHVTSMHEQYLEIIAHATGLAKEKVDELSRDALPLSPARAKELGIVHEIF